MEMGFDAANYTVNVRSAEFRGPATLDTNISAPISMSAFWNENPGAVGSISVYLQGVSALPCRLAMP